MTFNRGRGLTGIWIVVIFCALALSFALPQAAHATGDSTVAFQGTVTDKATGLPLKGAGVTVMGLDGYWSWGYTAADGTYAMFAPVSGDYDMYVDFYSGEYEGVALTAVAFDGTAATTQDVELERFPLAFQGTITDKTSGLPLEGVSVWVSGDLPSDHWFDVTTAADGTYKVFAPADTYNITFYASDPYIRIDLTGVVFDGTTTITRNAALEKYPLAFRGIVTDKTSGLPMEGISVSLSGGLADENSFADDTAADGTYVIYAPAGTYNIIASGSNDYKVIELTGVVFGGWVRSPSPGRMCSCRRDWSLRGSGPSFSTWSR